MTRLRGVNYVFHAAALKQVPSCEFYPMEAVRTNVLGAENVHARGDRARGVSRASCLSTDKAVYPINAMGMSKAMMEKVMVAKARLCDPGKTVLCATRYGNVMASRGSVIPLFLEQLQAGKPLTITDPNMTRFLMSLDESVDLVLLRLRARAARATSSCRRRRPPRSAISRRRCASCCGRDNEIRVIGTRHGEKLYESLVSREEMARAEDLGDYYRIPADSRDLNYDKYFVEGETPISRARRLHLAQHDAPRTSRPGQRGAA